MKSAGFTLLEMLVALAVLGMLLVGLNQTMRFGLIAWRQENRLSEDKTDMEGVDRALRLVVENLAPSSEPAQPAIDGSANALTGLTRLRVPGSGLQPVRIEAGLAVSGSRLVLRWRPFHHRQDFAPPSPAAETELASGVARLQIEYWGAKGVWLPRWQDPELPLLIRFHLVFAGETAPHWPDIIVAPLLSRP